MDERITMYIEACTLCGSKTLSKFLHRPSVSVHQNLLMQDRKQAKTITRSDLDLAVCEQCGFVFNTTFNSELLSYGESYDNNQGCSTSFQSHIDDLIALLMNKKGVRNKQVVEVGCGQGAFLGRLVQEGENSGTGFDPSYTGPAEAMDGRIRFESRYYDESCTDVPADVVICRHVIEHVPDPVSLLKSVRSAIGDNLNAKVFFETPCVEWILKNTVVWDFFYEHCSLFTTSSLTTAFQLAGFKVDEVIHVFGGQYLWIEASPIVSDVIFDSNSVCELASSYTKHEKSILKKWKRRIQLLSDAGRVALWGAGAKGSTFANLIDPENDLIDCLVDLNPNKQGKYVAGSGHEIVAPTLLKERGVSDIVLMNPNYRAENELILKKAGLAVNLID